jgi:hypothetical protein
MRAFMQSGVHRRVISRLPEWCDEAALVHWVQDAESSNRDIIGRIGSETCTM